MSASDPEQLVFLLDDLFTGLSQLEAPSVQKSRRKRTQLEPVQGDAEVQQYLQDISLDFGLDLPTRPKPSP